jgi:hypothetical protein
MEILSICIIITNLIAKSKKPQQVLKLDEITIDTTKIQINVISETT